ncbi:2-amino-4-hydroxy-6-hydroxymethyldihydropteridine diphosphokinase [Caldicellulosiruptoraceae bacterium PP1]
MSVFLGLGSNIGNREENINSAIKKLSKEIKIINISKFIETEPYGYTNQPKFINCALEGETNLTPYELLDFCLNIEKEMGRVREIRWGPRNIDIDILFYGSLIINSNILTIPHPEIEKRLFVLKPLNEIAPDFVHPIFKKSVNIMLSELLSKEGVKDE